MMCAARTRHRVDAAPARCATCRCRPRPPAGRTGPRRSAPAPSARAAAPVPGRGRPSGAGAGLRAPRSGSLERPRSTGEVRDRLFQALQRLRAEGRSSKDRPDKLLRAVGDDDLAGLRQAPAGARRCSACRRSPRLPARRPRRSGRPPRPARWRCRRARPAPRRRRSASSATAATAAMAGPNRPLGLVLMRLRPAEIGQHAVAHELRDVAVEARDLAGNRVLVAPARSGASLPDRVARMSAVEPTRSTNSTDKLAALGRIDGRVGVGRRWRAAKAPAMALSSRRRGPSAMPRPLRSSSVRSGRTSTSICCAARTACSAPSPRASSQSARALIALSGSARVQATGVAAAADPIGDRRSRPW